MVRVSVEVSSGDVCFSVDVLADSIEGAIRLAGSHYPGRKVQVLFPIEPETFFARPGAGKDRTVLVGASEAISG